MTRYTVLVKADKLKKVITIPPEFEHKEVEVVISLPRKKKFNPSKYHGIFNIPKETVDNDLKRIRVEWERNGG